MSYFCRASRSAYRLRAVAQPLFSRRGNPTFLSSIYVSRTQTQFLCHIVLHKARIHPGVISRNRAARRNRSANINRKKTKMDIIFALLDMSGTSWAIWGVVLLLLFIVWKSLWTIGPTEVGLVRKRFSLRKMPEGSPVAFNGEAGYQGELLLAGSRFKFWPLFAVTRHPMVQIPAGQIG